MDRLCMILSLLLLTGCAALRPPVTATDTVTIVNNVVRDSIVVTPADSAIMRAWFECDSLNQVIMTQIEEAGGKTIKTNSVFTNGMATITAKIPPQDIFLKWEEKHEATHTTNTVTKLVEVEKPPSAKTVWLLFLGGLGTGAISILILVLFLKIKI